MIDSKLAKTLSGSFTNAQELEQFIKERDSLLNTDGVSVLNGHITQAGALNDGSFFVGFVSGSAGWATAWPQWAYEVARDAVLNGKQIMITYVGTAPYGSNLTGAHILSAAA